MTLILVRKAAMLWCGSQPALELIMAAAISAGYDPKRETRLGVDVGSPALYDELENKYIFL